jgi:L-seryl-tRNA(Ser) seleniumtransferase
LKDRVVDSRRIPLNKFLRAFRWVPLLWLAFSCTLTAVEPAWVAGRWDITIHFVYGDGKYTAFFEQTGEKLHGTYRGQTTEGTLDGTIEGANIRFRGHLKIEGAHLVYDYKGTVEGDQIEGKVDLDEYGEARWVARKH